VESIGLRSTRIRDIDESVTTIPNGDFSKMHLVNYSMRKTVYLSTVLGLRCETTDDQLRFCSGQVARDAVGASAHPRIRASPASSRMSGSLASAIPV
jgi:MscS family membrane protein